MNYFLCERRVGGWLVVWSRWGRCGGLGVTAGGLICMYGREQQLSRAARRAQLFRWCFQDRPPPCLPLKNSPFSATHMLFIQLTRREEANWETCINLSQQQQQHNELRQLPKNWLNLLGKQRGVRGGGGGPEQHHERCHKKGRELGGGGGVLIK